MEPVLKSLTLNHILIKQYYFYPSETLANKAQNDPKCKYVESPTPRVHKIHKP